MFNKDPIVYANPHPEEQDYGYLSSQHHASHQRNASLRMRSPNRNSGGSPTDEYSSSVLDAQGSAFNGTGTMHPDEAAKMRYQNLPNTRSDFSPSVLTSGFSERGSPLRPLPRHMLAQH